MGALKTVNNIDIHYQYADFSVDTPGYWKLLAHNDFDNGQLVMVNGVPKRQYHHKQILKFDFSKFGDAFTDSIRTTLTNLLNETFVTLFADNQPFISAVTLGNHEAPNTYNLALDEGVEASDKCIFVIEDSQLDIGLLVAVERNINRILHIISDYLQWNDELIQESLREETEKEKETTPFDVYEEEPAPKKKGFFGKIGDWFKGLFKKKNKPDTMTVPEQDYMMIYGKPHKLVKGKWKRCSQKEFDEKMKKRHRTIDEIKEVEKESKEAENQAEQSPNGEAEINEEQSTITEEKPVKQSFFKRWRNSLSKKKHDETTEEIITPTQEEEQIVVGEEKTVEIIDEETENAESPDVETFSQVDEEFAGTGEEQVEEEATEELTDDEVSADEE